jgi:hypothetical protein
MNDYGEAKFKEYARDNRLRIKRGEDGFPIVTSTNKYKGFHLFDGFGDTHVGLYAVKGTKRKFSFIHSKLVSMGCLPHVIADAEGTYKIPYQNLLSIATELKMVKKAPTGIDPVWLRKNE